LAPIVSKYKTQDTLRLLQIKTENPITAPVKNSMERFFTKLGNAYPRSPSATSEFTSMKVGEDASKKV
jgi:hypothetical protein